MPSKVIRNITKVFRSASGVLFGRKTAGTGRGEELTPADVRTLISVYSTSEVDAIIGGIDGLTDADIDTLAEINAILTDADLASVSYVDGLASNYATATQGSLADSALQPADIASGTITPRSDDVNLSGGSDGDVLTVQADGSLALETPSSGGGIDTLGTSGTDLNISGSTLNVPNASATARGVVTTGTQTIAGDKSFSGSTTTAILGITSAGYLALASKTYTRTDIAIRMNWGSGASGGIYGSNGNVGFAVASSFFFDAVNTRVCVPSVSGYAIGGTTSPAHHVMLASPSSGVMEINNGTLGTYRDLKLRDATLSGLHCVGTYTVGTLPSAAANSGKEAQVTDAADALSSTTVGTTVSGGGANRVKVFSNGSNWVYA